MERILLFGGSGILGSEVLCLLQNENLDYVAPASSDLDITNKDLLLRFISEFKPTWIVNCAAWTNVDGAESSFEEARQLNSIAVENMGIAAELFGCKVIHISTDYVFDGDASEPYTENSFALPINKYGESKLQGERALLAVTPSARDLATGVISMFKNQPEPGIYNYSNQGSCSWFELAQRIYKTVGANQALVLPISSESLSFIAKRPKFSLLSKEKWISAGLSEVPKWEDSLQLMVPEIISQLR